MTKAKCGALPSNVSYSRSQIAVSGRMEEIEEASARCKAVVERIHSFPLSKITSSCKSTLLRLANSELNFLSRLSLSPKPFSCNIGYVEAVVHILHQPYITKVSRVCKLITLPSPTNNGERTVTQCEAVHVDIVCSLNYNPTWFVISDRNPRYIEWDTSGTNRGLRLRIEQIIHAAHSSQAMKPTFIVLFFANGLEITILKLLEKDFGFRGFKLEFPHYDFAFADALHGEWINVIAKSYQGACTLVLDIEQCRKPCQSIDCVVKLPSANVHKEFPGTFNGLSLGSSFLSLIMEMKETPLDVKDLQCQRDLARDGDIANFDTTALIAIISGISNGGAEKLLVTQADELRQRFKNNTEFVISQARSEIERPIHDELCCILSAKKGIACESVHSEFMDIVSMCGGPNEKMRAAQLLKLLKVFFLGVAICDDLGSTGTFGYRAQFIIVVEVLVFEEALVKANRSGLSGPVIRRDNLFIVNLVWDLEDPS